MKPAGFVKLHRKITEHWLWTGEPFDRAHAWIDLLLMANWKPSKRIFNGRVIDQGRGQVVCTIRFLADRWGWSPKKVRRFLKTLQNDGMLSVKGQTNGTTITIEKYAFFQDWGQTDDPTSDPTDDPTDDPQHKKNKEKKEIKEEPAGTTVEAVPMPDEFKQQLATMFSWRKDN